MKITLMFMEISILLNYVSLDISLIQNTYLYYMEDTPPWRLASKMHQTYTEFSGCENKNEEESIDIIVPDPGRNYE